MVTSITPFPAGTLESVCKIIGDLYSGSELTRICSEVPLKSDPGEGMTRWKRLYTAVVTNQTSTGNGNALVKLVAVSLRPDRTLDRKSRSDVAKDQLNQALSLVGLKVTERGQVATAKRATSDSEALDRTSRLRSLLERRGAHTEVLNYCRPELLRSDYYEAVFEAIKGLGARVRLLTSVDADGYSLIESTMAGKEPLLRINPGLTKTERDEQLGIANLAKGLFSAFRNPAAHETRVHWQVSEEDALDVLGTLSLIHRRLDHAATA